MKHNFKDKFLRILLISKNSLYSLSNGGRSERKILVIFQKKPFRKLRKANTHYSKWGSNQDLILND